MELWNGGGSQAAGLCWQLLRAPEQFSVHGPLVQHQNPSKPLPSWQGLEQGCGGAGRGLGAQGNPSPRSASRGEFPRLLPPTQRLPPLLLELGQAFPAKSSWLHNSAPGWAAPVLQSENQGRTQNTQRPVSSSPRPSTGAQLPACQLPVKDPAGAGEPWSGHTCTGASWSGGTQPRAEASGTGKEQRHRGSRVTAGCTWYRLRGFGRGSWSGPCATSCWTC